MFGGALSDELSAVFARFRAEVEGRGGTLLAFGRAVWPHALCRTMLAEQLYRALAILGGHPYHRGA